MGTSVPKDQGIAWSVRQPQCQSGPSQRLHVNSSFKVIVGGQSTGWQVSGEGSRISARQVPYMKVESHANTGVFVLQDRTEGRRVRVRMNAGATLGSGS